MNPVGCFGIDLHFAVLILSIVDFVLGGPFAFWISRAEDFDTGFNPDGSQKIPTLYEATIELYFGIGTLITLISSLLLWRAWSKDSFKLCVVWMVFVAIAFPGLLITSVILYCKGLVQIWLVLITSIVVVYKVYSFWVVYCYMMEELRPSGGRWDLIDNERAEDNNEPSTQNENNDPEPIQAEGGTR